MDFHYVQLQRKFHCVDKSSYHLKAVLEIVETIGRTVYIVIFPDKCIQGTYASECRPMFLTWFWQIRKSMCLFSSLLNIA
ncbi:hypothetical protein ACOSP7_017654 [Xanthoceras sorbifolium]